MEPKTNTKTAMFMRQQAGDCLTLAKRTADTGLFTEMVVMAATLHDRAVVIESRIGQGECGD
jgi:hypothetical protein